MFMRLEGEYMKCSTIAATAVVFAIFSSAALSYDTEELSITGKMKILSGKDSVEVFVGKKLKNDVFDRNEYYAFSGGALMFYGYKSATGNEVIFPTPYIGLPKDPISVGDNWTGYLDMATSEKVLAKSTAELFGKTYPSIEILISTQQNVALVKKWHLEGVGMLGAESVLANFSYYSRLDSFEIVGGTGYMPMAVGNRWHWIISDKPITTGVAGKTPGSFKLHQAAPNPFNPATVIGFDIYTAGHVRLAIYDILGREIAVLRDAHLAAGSYSCVWDGRDGNGLRTASGVYLYRLQAGAFAASGKVMLVR